MKTIRAKLNSKGFTLTEMLVTVAVIVVLIALMMLPINSIRLKLRQTELDAKAEQIYIAAQNTLSNLRSAGQYERYAGDINGNVIPVPYVPSDADTEVISDGTLYYVDSADRGSAGVCSTVILPENCIEKEIWSNNWVIEFNPESGSVYAVFYWEHSAEYRFSEFDGLRYREDRLADGARVGYYGGDASESGETKQLEPHITVNNGEVLSIRFTVEAIDNSEVTFKATIRDEHGNTVNVPLEVSRSGRTWYSSTVLDDLSSESKRFKNVWPSLTPGDDLYIEFTAESSNRRIAGKTVSDEVNSLFGSRNDGTVYVSCGRHLQNLDSASGVNTGLAPGETVSVKQTGSIYFNDDINKDDDWYSVYGGKQFDPINNEKINSFTGLTDSGQNTVIYGLNAAVDENGNSGLFGTFCGTALTEIRLADAKTAQSGARNAGVLAAEIRTGGTVNISGCRVYLEDYPAGMSCENYYMRASENAGGLAGYVYGSGSLRIEDSFASTLVYSYGGNAGGLAGGTENNITVSGSYSDSYLYGYSAGGLVGAASSGCGVSVSESYTAGFITARGYGAGLVCGTLSSARYVYSAMDLEADAGTDAVLYSTGRSGSSNYNVYYISGGVNLDGTESVSDDVLSSRSSFITSNLTGAFTSVTDQNYSNPYNLTGKISGGLSTYSYPRLDGLDHYGDWQAAFESGRLIYYEAYLDGGDIVYGFYGANVNCLRDDLPVVGDGYGVIFISPAKMDITYAGDDGTEITYSDNVGGQSTVIRVTYGGKEYKLVPLAKNGTNDPVNTEYAPNSFYQRISVRSQGTTTVYWYNPHFAKTAVQSESCPSVPRTVEIRTARQLNNLSKFYSSYRRASGSTYQFVQTLDIDYTGSYDWNKYSRTTVSGTTAYQQPIGTDDGNSFRDSYNGNGHTISGVSFRTNGSLNAGLFGVNTGTLQNIVIVSDDYSGSVSFGTAPQGAAATGNIGVLAGKNSGIINNCAVAGYSADVTAYTNSSVYAGGLVGYNGGVIRNSSAVSREFDIYNTNANVRCGGFAGANTSEISGCYALGYAEVKESTGTAVTVAAGFAARNSGTVTSCYCASASVSSGTAQGYAFAPEGGHVNGCGYLFGASFRYIDSLYLYSNSEGAGSAKTDAELRSFDIPGFGTASRTLYHASTEGADYPYPAVVRDANGNLIHYGDWTTPAVLGNVGVFYWEHETGGSNEGYHINYVGVKDDLNVETADTLCTSHDDGGVITEYGYGYYTSRSDVSSEVTLSIDGTVISASENSEASAAYNDQFIQYEFHAFDTLAEGSGTPGLYTTGNKRNSEWIITYSSPELSAPYYYSYTVSPFFGNSFRYNGVRQGNSGGWNTGDLAQKSPVKIIEPGNAGNPYEIRSITQLQFINWNYGSRNCSTIVTQDNYKQYPYLQYTTNTGEATQTAASAYGQTQRSMQYWIQTHDADGSVGFSGNFTPIAATYETSSNKISTSIWSDPWGFISELFDSGYNAVLYTWFGGSYDGQSYKLMNIDITSDAVNTGLFGTTAGADMRNIVMYSDKNSTILHNGDRLGAYAVGGLIGIAYDYQNPSGHKITNCAISGYTIKDSFTGTLTPGEANMGGLIGIANVSLSGCSAVNDIIIDTQFKEYCRFQNNDFGNFLRVGGLVGANVDTVSSCYTGGSISVEDRSRMQFCTGSSKDRTKSTNIYIGGIGGSSFGANYQNFSGSGGAAYHTATYENCYTYTKLPDFGGAVRVVSTIASVADRQGKVVYTYKILTEHSYTVTTRNEDGINIRNCYYLDSIANISDLNGSGAYDSEPKLAAGDFELMLQGKISKLSKDKSTYYWRDTDINSKGASANQNITVTSLTYGQMKDTVSNDGLLHRLGTGTFSTVTTEENGARVNGKYSFSGGTAALDGLDYPFPTVLTQQTASGGTANVHYGEWPTGDLYWEQSAYEFDLITSTGNYSLHVKYEGTEASPVASGLTLSARSDIDEELPEGTIAFGNAVYADGWYTVPVHCVTEGAYRLYAEYGGYTAVCVLKLSGIVNVSAEPESAAIFIGEDEAVFEFTASDVNGDPLGSLIWSTSCIPDDSNVYIESKNASGSRIAVSGVNPGETWIEMTATYTTGTHSYSGSATVRVETKETSVIGLHDRTVDRYLNTFNQITVSGSGAVSGDVVITTGQPDPGEDTELFAYSKGSETDLGTAVITALYVEDAGGLHAAAKNDGSGAVYGAPENASADGKYSVTVGGLISAGMTDDPSAGYSYIPMALSGSGSGEVTLHVTFTIGESDYPLAVRHAVSDEVTLKWYDAAGNLLGTTTGRYGISPGECGMPDETALSGWIAAGVENTEGRRYIETNQDDPGYADDLLTYMSNSDSWTPAFGAVYGTASYSLREITNISFNANGGSFGPGPDGQPVTVITNTVIPGSTVAVPSDPSRDSFRFDGWYDGTGVPFDFTNTTLTENVTLYANWIRQRTVTFKVLPDSGEIYDQCVVDDGSAVSRPENDPVFGTLPFAGWYYMDGAAEKEYDFSSPVTDDITVYGKWTVKVTFHWNTSNSNIEIRDYYFYYNSVIPGEGMPEDPPSYQTGSFIKTTHYFNGWYTAENGGNKVDSSNTLTLEHDIHLYSHFS